jgi:uncharacterized membrane protein
MASQTRGSGLGLAGYGFFFFLSNLMWLFSLFFFFCILFFQIDDVSHSNWMLQKG